MPEQELALDAVRTVTVASPGGGPPEIDTKKYAKVEKLPGGSLEDCRVLSGVMFQKVGLAYFCKNPPPSIWKGGWSAAPAPLL